MRLDHQALAPVRDVRLEQVTAGDWATRAGRLWERPDELIEFLRGNTNHLDAAEALHWDGLLTPGARVLDLGCGAGWLTAMLSTREEVAEVIAMDGSPHLLENVLPGVLEILGGRAEVVERVCGSFTPLPLDDSSVNLVVMGSAFHHSDSPDALLDELARVLARGGAVALVNETPWRRLAMANLALRTIVVTALNLLGSDRIRRIPGHLASSHAVYDDVLGDRAYTLAQWRDLARRHAFELEVRDSGLYPYKRAFRAPSLLEGKLAHLILRPRGA